MTPSVGFDIPIQMKTIDKNKWIEFAKETVKEDRVKTALDFEEFGNLMVKVFDRFGTIESVLWEGANPSGTEDRTWVRTYLALKGVPEYRVYATEPLLDDHAQRIARRFQEVG